MKRFLQKRRPAFSLCFLTAICMLLSGCGSDGQSMENDGVSLESYDFSYTDRELDASYDESAATSILLADGAITIDGEGAEADGNVLSITAEGAYILSGSLSDGQIIVETPDDEKVQLVLNGIHIASSGSAPVLIKESDKVFLTLAPGSSNVLTGPAAYSDEAAADSIDGVIFSKADLCINGSGALNVTAEAEHGIVSRDDLVVTGGEITVTAPGDGLQGKDCVKIKDGTFAIDADNDGVKSSNAEDAGRGFVSIDGGQFTLTAGYDGIQAETVLRVAGGEFSINTGGGSQYASNQADWGTTWGGDTNRQTPGDMMTPGGGMQEGDANAQDRGMQEGDADAQDRGMQEADANAQGGGMQQGEQTTAGGDQMTNGSDASSDTVSAKGLKGNLAVFILDGSLTIDSSDDAIHSNGDVSVESGSISISSGDDGIHADSDLLVADGALTISQSYEGIEGNTITIGGGNIDITASDDGLNAAGGADGSSVDGRAGQDPFAVDESAFIEINGGDLTISASGDGIDSNGTLTITDGDITVSCPAMGDTAVMDYASEGSITGGTFIGTGAVQMAQTFSSSGQGVVAVSVGQQAAGSVITLTDGDGNTIMSFEAAQAFSVVILSSPDIASGETYTLAAGSASGEVTANQ